jgi:hypothetical protein
MASIGKALPFFLFPALGVVAGWASLKTSGGRVDPEEPPPPASPQSGREQRDSRPAWTTEDLLKAATDRAAQRKAGASSPLQELLGDWTVDEIRAALDQAAKEPAALLGDRDLTAVVLLRCYVARDLDAALDWFQGQPEILRAQWMVHIASEWPEDRALEGLDFMEKYRDQEGEGADSEPFIVAKCVKAGARDGPEALISLFRRLKEENLPMDFRGDLDFPPSFDYAGMMAKADPEMLVNLQHFLAAGWLKQDREAAFRWAMGQNGPHGVEQLMKFNPRDTVHLVPWYLGKVAALPAEQRQEVMASRANSWFMNNIGAEMWISAATTPEMKNQLRHAAMQGIYGRSKLQALSVLESIPDVGERLRHLETLQPMNAGINHPMSPVDEKMLRGKLQEWGADQARVDAIIERYRDPEKP